MDWGGPTFVIAIIAISTAGWLINNWIRAKHGYDLEDEWGGKTATKSSDDAKQLRDENVRLVELVEAQGKRMETLERIVTDKGYRLNEEIEALRDTSAPSSSRADHGVPLDIKTKGRT